MKSLDLAIRTLFAEFQEAVWRREAIEQALHQEEIFVRKRVKGKVYWYAQRGVEGKAIQRYVEPSTPETDERMLANRQRQRGERTTLRQLLQVERRHAALLRRAGLPSLEALTAQVIERLAETLLTKGDGILIGSHAFACYSGMFGRLFEQDTLRTMDIDVAHKMTVATALEQTIDMEKMLRLGDHRFRPVPGLSPKDFPSSFLGPGGLRVDFVTPLQGKPSGVRKLPGMTHAGAIPLPYLDFLIEDATHGVLIGPRGGIPITVPDPTRFAIHKLIVAAERQAFEAAKRIKDLRQAAQMIEASAEERPYELATVCREACRRGPKWQRALRRAVALLPPETAAKLAQTP